MSFGQIPEELRNLNQWIMWNYEGKDKPTKVPYDPKSGKLASVNERSTWSTFEECLNVFNLGNYSGIGFVFTDKDEYCFIDLDDTQGDTIAYDRQIKIYHELNSYSEVSPSGKGLHIICRANVPAGRRRSFIEIYSSQRYATFTGNVYNDVPIADCQDKVEQLWQQMGNAGAQTLVYQGDDKEKFNDKEIIEQASNASNGEKFRQLLLGNWNDLYQSQSEADFAFIDIISFYTQNRNQITRLFYSSALGKRAKAQRKDYLAWMINKSFDRMLPPIDFDGFKNELELKLAKNGPVAQRLEPAAHNGLVVGSNPTRTTGVSFNGKTAPFEGANLGSTPSTPTNVYSLPPGLLGELAQFIYSTAPRPVPEIALAGAIGLMAGVTGRAYNISGTGLNQYVLLIANTGTGKEAMALGIDRLMNTIRLQVPTSISFIGPSEISSGQALLKHLNKTSQCFVSILGEFGLRLQNMSREHANASEVSLRRMLLDLFNKSGHGQIFRPSIYSDRDKNIEATEAPSFTILGESVPDNFYNSLTEDMISEGLLPRFILIEYNGIRVPLSKTHQQAVPSMMLVEKFASLVANCEQIMHSKKVINIKFTDEALAITEEFDRFADNQINETNKRVTRELWNRAHIKVLKLSGLIAVGVNMWEPLITAEYVQWAINLIQKDILTLASKFDTGQIGSSSSEIKQTSELVRIIKDFVTLEWDKVKGYCTNGKNLNKLHHEKIIPYSYLNRRLGATSSYRLDKLGATIALKRAIQILIDSDKIREIGKQELAIKYDTSQRAFVISDMGLLDD